MNALQLYTADGQPTSVWACGACHGIKSVYDKRIGAYSLKLGAERCCRSICRECGVEPPKAFRPGESDICEACRADYEVRWKAKEAELLRARLETAADVTDTYTGMLFYDDHYWESDEDPLEHFDGEALPEYVFACTSHIRQLDLSQAIASLCEDGYENMEDLVDAPSAAMEAAVAEWNEANQRALTVYEPDYSRKVRLYGTAGEESQAEHRQDSDAGGGTGEPGAGAGGPV